MNNHLLSLSNINMVFHKSSASLSGERSFHVLKDVNLNVDEGEILAIVGESGCGKTTLGKIITGLLNPTSGTILFKGEELKNFTKTMKDFRESVQFVQQDSYAALNPVRTIYQSLEASLEVKHKHLSRREKHERIEELLKTVGLFPADQYLDKFPHQLSGGQRQRILMARALSLDPKIILCDEPVSMIDVSLRISILNLMKRLNKEQNITFVYITHDLATARYIANEGKMAVMYLGEIVEYGALNAILTNPLHPYTKALIAAVPIPNPKLAHEQKEIPIKSMELMSIEKRNSGCPFASRCLYEKDACHLDIKTTINENDVAVKCILMEEKE